MARAVFKEALDRPTAWQRLTGRWTALRLSRLPEPPLGADKVGVYVSALQHRRAEAALAPVVRALIWSDIRSRQYRPECLNWYTQAIRRYMDDERCNFYVAGLAFRGILSMVDDERNEVFGRILRPEWRDSPWWSKLELPRADLMQYVVRALLREDNAGEFSDENLGLFESALQSNLLDSETLWAASRALAAGYRRQGRRDEMARSVYRLVFDRVPEDVDNALWLGELLLSDGLSDGASVRVYEHLFQVLGEGRDADLAARRWAVAASSAYVGQGRVPSGSARLLREASVAHPDRSDFAVAAARAIASRAGDDLQDDEIEFVRDVWVRWGTDLGGPEAPTFPGLVAFLSSGTVRGRFPAGSDSGPHLGSRLLESGATVSTVRLGRVPVTEGVA